MLMEVTDSFNRLLLRLEEQVKIQRVVSKLLRGVRIADSKRPTMEYFSVGPRL